MFCLNTKHRAFALVGAVSLAALLSCSSSPPPGTVYAQRGPPPDRVEVIETAPGPNYAYTRGYWVWTGNDYTWTPGRWVVVERGYNRWVPGHWNHNRFGWYWVDGHWS